MTLTNGHGIRPISSATQRNGDSRPSVKYFPAQRNWDRDRPVKVVIVGAGLGGTIAALLLSRKIKNLTIDVFDRFDKIGGTWVANVYPGVRCDVPSHAYQMSFAPNTQWTEYYPRGDDIQQYYEKTVKQFGLFDRFHLKHEVLKATWLQREKIWSIEVQDLRLGGTRKVTADFFINSQGRITTPKHPSVEGLYSKFRGQVVHTAQWKKGLDLTGKRVAVIGNGASGQQIIPNILTQVEHIDHYVRSNTWVTTFAKELHEATADAPGGPKFSAEQLELFQKDPKAYLEFRRELLLIFHPKTGADVLGSPENQALRMRIIESMRQRVNGDEEFLAKILPDYAPGCKRPTSGPGYLEALVGPKVDYINNPIIEADETGLRTEDGTHRKVDTIITATGFDNEFTTKFPIVGLDGIDLRDKWSKDGDIGFPNSYLGVMAPGYPNYFTILQAQGTARGGAVPLHVELAATFIAKSIRKIQAQSYVALHPSEEAATEFNDIVSGFFDDKVTMDKCNSWWKAGSGRSRFVISWPGSFHHRADNLADPRWEDFHFIRARDAKRNRFEYFGNGWTEREARGDELDVTAYLKEVIEPELAAAQAHE